MASTPAGFDRIRRPGDPTTKMHPMLSATQFAQTSNATGGATMDLHTGRVFAAGTREKPGRYDLWSTGGAPDTEGTKIPSEIVPHVNGQRDSREPDRPVPARQAPTRQYGSRHRYRA